MNPHRTLDDEYPFAAVANSKTESSKNPFHQSGRPSLKRAWSEFVKSEKCPQEISSMTKKNPLNLIAYIDSGNYEYRCKVKTELERRDQASAKTDSQRCGSTNAFDEEHKRRMKWAQEMIITNPELCAEICHIAPEEPQQGR